MSGLARSRGRLALIGAAVAVVACVALPTIASAKVATKLSAPLRVTVDNSIVGTTAVAPTVTVKLYRKKGSKWLSLSGQVKCYFVDPEADEDTLVGTATGSKVSFVLPQRGAYNFVYRGSKKYRAAYDSTGRVDSIGAVLSTPTISVDEIDSSYSRVNVSYDVTWNAEAFKGPILVTHVGQFVTDEGDEPYPFYTVIPTGLTMFARVIDEPDAVQFSYRVKTSSVAGIFMTLAAISPGDRFVDIDESPVVSYWSPE